MMRKSPFEWKQLFDSKEFQTKYENDEKKQGAFVNGETTTFCVWAPTAESVLLKLYKGGNEENEDLLECIKMDPIDGGYWEKAFQKNMDGIYYTYTVTVEGIARETQDVYSVACGVNGKRSMVIDLQKTNPEEWDEDKNRRVNYEKPIIWEVHIKDFSYDQNSGIPEKDRGKYAAFTYFDTQLTGRTNCPTCLEYLKNSEITYVHLLPTYDYGSVDEASSDKSQYNWGYDPVNYNVPEGSYSSDPENGSVRIREFKEMVQSLHKAGIGVIMDVVYNHTYSLDSCFQKTVPYYYYRVEEDGTLSNGSVCGNDTASEREMYRRYMIHSVCYWAKEYHIDGFRFDLMGLHDVETMNQIRIALNQLPGGEKILMYGEPWAGGKTAMREGSVPAVKANAEQLLPGISFFNDDIRDAIKGSVFFEKEPGFVNGGEDFEEEIASSVTAWCDKKGGYQPSHPMQSMTYVSAHDNWTLWDKLCITLLKHVTYEEKHEVILQANRMAAGIYLTCLGTVFFQAGEECGRTKLGDPNSYASSPKLNAIDWKRMYSFSDLKEYYEGILKIRKRFSGYWKKDRKVLDAIQFYKKEDGCVAFSFDSMEKTDAWKRLWIIYTTKTQKLTLPEAERILLSDGVWIFENGLPETEKSVYELMANRVYIYAEK